MHIFTFVSSDMTAEIFTFAKDNARDGRAGFHFFFVISVLLLLLATGSSVTVAPVDDRSSQKSQKREIAVT